ncbi:MULTISPECIES: adenylate/guanylate cyclase domain-containing protein [Micromonospora]|uniref:adenylate/guanylate cyclase domain-containing protein n=1 Tax=Micromonospora TaxID=1873 RepID=UPI0001C4771E|nr:adenylate/guanylate cyclase domain-containing protein [Micromonospora sp. L5]ADU09129.1 hypothetical protein ML5_3615 [Micromonospora sp. L5]
MAPVVQSQRRLIMFVDMESYSRNDDVGQFHAQKNFQKVMREAADLCGLDRRGWTVQATGDGEFAIFPPGTSEPRIVAELVPAMDRVLRDHNRQAADHARIRMRVAMHQGLVAPAENGFAGKAVVTAARLVNAEPLRDALGSFPDAAVALIVSDAIYRDVVSQSYSGIRPDRFRRVLVEVKSFVSEAWIFVPDENVNCSPMVPAVDRHSGTRRRVGKVKQPPGGRATGSRFDFGTVTNNGPTVYGDNGRAYGLHAAWCEDEEGES